MTFIASVIARDGVAIVADSLVTSMHEIIERPDFTKLLKSKSGTISKKKINFISAEEINKLFKYKPSHTKDYENKLMKYDDFTAITTTGTAWINDKRIENLIYKVIENNKHDKDYENKTIEQKIQDLCKYLKAEVIEHVKKYKYINTTIFIVSHYDVNTKKVNIYRIYVHASSIKSLQNSSYIPVEYTQSRKYERVVCEGQSSISNRILLGELPIVYSLIPKVFDRLVLGKKISKKKLTKKYKDRIISEFADAKVFESANMFKLVDLSLQQAVDLAYLLISVELELQKYTKNIPTVGGVIKLAVIDKDAFQFISGDKITKPQPLH